MTPGLTQMYREQVEQRQEDVSELRAQYRLRVALARARLQGNDSIERMKQGEASDMRAGAEDLFLKFLHWKPSRPRPVVQALCPDCSDFAYGRGLGQALWTWISRLHIGDEAEGPLDRSLMVGTVHGVHGDMPCLDPSQAYPKGKCLVCLAHH